MNFDSNVIPVSPPHPTRFADMFAPAFVDVFAGLGGWSVGEELAFARAGYDDKYIDLMINHWDTAVSVHQANHPMTQHLRANVLEVDPNAVLLGRRIMHAHFSPDCTDHSKAKGGKPRRKEIRALADVVIVWAGKRRPDVITLENVEEFQQWGPLLDSGHPDPARRGQEFKRWVRELEALGYVVEWRELRACNYGAPTTRKRLFVIARCDGRPIVWPEKTHGVSNERSTDDAAVETRGLEPARSNASPRYAGRHARRNGKQHRFPHRVGVAAAQEGSAGRRGTMKPYRTAASCIDWQTPMLSIFATRPEAREWAKALNVGREKFDRVGVPQRPLRLNTQKRLAGGLWKWVLDHANPFIVHIAHGEHSNGSERWGNPTHSVSQPLPTVTGSKDFGVVDVELAGFVSRTDMMQSNAACTYPVDHPLTTITTASGHAVAGAKVSPMIVGTGGATYAGKPVPADRPFGTVMTDDRRALAAIQVAPFTAGVGGRAGQSPSTSGDAPLPTVTGKADRAIVAAELAPFTIPRYGEADGQAPRSGSVEDPLPTITSTDNGAQLAAVAMARSNQTDGGASASDPLRTVIGTDHHSLLAVHLTQYHTEKGAEEVRAQGANEPIKTLDTQNRFGAVAAHIVKFRGESPGTAADAPIDTITAGSNSGRPAGAGHAMGLSACYLSHMYTSNTCGGQGDPRRPLKTITSGGQHANLAVIYLAPYYGEGSGKTGHSPAQPMPTVVGTDRFALVGAETTSHFILTEPALNRAKQVAAWAREMLGAKVERFLLSVRDEAGKVFQLLTLSVEGALHLVTDVLMRMLKPRELARAQGFDDSYVIDRTADGRRISKADQVKLIGNSVPPVFAEAITKANIIDQGMLDDYVPSRRKAVTA